MATFIKAGFWEKLCKPCKGYKGWLNLDEFVKENSGGPSYKVYTALLTQEGTNPPTAVVLENTIGNIVWTYYNTGQYFVNLNGAFPELKTALFITDTTYNTPSNAYILTNGSGDRVVVETYNAANTALSNDILGLTTVEIRVYP